LRGSRPVQCRCGPLAHTALALSLPKAVVARMAMTTAGNDRYERLRSPTHTLSPSSTHTLSPSPTHTLSPSPTHRLLAAAGARALRQGARIGLSDSRWEAKRRSPTSSLPSLMSLVWRRCATSWSRARGASPVAG
jgi:hypothetical protein